MATIKSFTSLEQSRKLAEFLSYESADMGYICEDFVDEDTGEIVEVQQVVLGYIENSTPCWSLTALLNVLPDGTNLIKEDADTENEHYMCTVGVKDDIISTFGDNPVDACVDMIEKLHELKML